MDRPGDSPDAGRGGGATAARLAAAIDGDRASVAWLVERFDPALHAAARWHLRGRLARVCDGDDLVHEVWLVALGRLASGDPERIAAAPRFLAFLSGVMRHLVNDLLRRHLRGDAPRIASGLGGGDGVRPDGDPRSAVWRAEVTSVTARVESTEARRRFREALSALDETDRAVVVLRGIEQVSARETATIVGSTEGAVAVRYHRARAKLRERLRASFLDDVP